MSIFSTMSWPWEGLIPTISSRSKAPHPLTFLHMHSRIHSLDHSSFTHARTHPVEKYAIEFTDRRDLLAPPSVPLSTWVQVDGSVVDTITPPESLVTGAVIGFYTWCRAFGMFVHVHFVCSVMTLTQRSDIKPCVVHC